jgi:VanZ family protein
MTERRNNSSSFDSNRSSLRDRVWRYGPLVVWMLIIFAGSTDVLSASHSGMILRPIVLRLFPNISEAGLATIHFFVRKLSHFSEYAILALLAGRAFYASTHAGLRHKWFTAALVLVIIYAFSDEFHQSFEASRTASIYDSFIDIAGGATALLFFAWRRRRRMDA